MNRTSVALISAVLVSVSVGAYFLLQSLRAEEEVAEKDAQHEVEDDLNNETLPEKETPKDLEATTSGLRISDEDQRKVMEMEGTEKEFLLAIDAAEATLIAVSANARKEEQGLDVTSESARLKDQMRSIEMRQDQLMEKMRKLGGDAAVEVLRQAAARYIQAKERAHNVERAKAAAASRTMDHAQLAHLIQHNPNFKVQREKSPLEERIAKIAKQAYWDAVTEKMTEGENATFIELLRTCNAKLIELSGGRFRDENIVDIALVSQVLDNSKIDASVLRDVIESYIATLKRLDSADNDRGTDQWLKDSLEQLDGCTTEAKCIHIVPTLFQWLLDKMEEIEMAILNFRIQQVKPFLQTHGTDYVRAKFDETQQEFKSSKAWIREVMDTEKARSELDFVKLEAGDSVSTLTFIIRAIIYRLSTKDNDTPGQSHDLIVPELLSLETDILVGCHSRWTVLVLSIFTTMIMKQVLQSEGTPLQNWDEEKKLKDSIMQIICASRAKADKSNLKPIVEDVSHDILETEEDTVDVSKVGVKNAANFFEKKIEDQSPEKQKKIEEDVKQKEQEKKEGKRKERQLMKIIIPKVPSEAEMAESCAAQFIQFVQDFKRQRGASSDISSAGRSALQSVSDPTHKILGLVKDRVRSAVTLQVTLEALRVNSTDPGSEECRRNLSKFGASMFEDDVVKLAKDVATLAKRNAQLHASHYNRLIHEALHARDDGDGESKTLTPAANQ